MAKGKCCVWVAPPEASLGEAIADGFRCFARAGHKGDHVPGCSARVWHAVGNWGERYPCERAGTITEDGKPWCATHAPSKALAREEAKRARWRAEREAKQRAYQAEADQRRRGTYALRACKRLMEYAEGAASSCGAAVSMARIALGQDPLPELDETPDVE